MKFRDFLKDKLYLILITVGISLLIGFFFYVLKIKMQVTILVLMLVWFICISVLIIEWLRRFEYYRELTRNLEALDRKYLLTEIVSEPNFVDGKILYQALQANSKSMADEIRKYEGAQKNYQEYLELWIHEVKTPLAGAKLILDTNAQPSPEALKRSLKQIETYLEQILFYARSASVEKDYLVQTLNLKEHVQTVIKELAPYFIQKQVQVTVNIPEDLHIISDPKWIEYIIKQILDNALKYVAPEQGEITIVAKQQAHAVTLTISDNGPGIPSHDLNRIFDRGFTGKMGRSHKQATGMGLFLVKELTQSLRIGVSVSTQKGTHVTLMFPKSNVRFD